MKIFISLYLFFLYCSLNLFGQNASNDTIILTPKQIQSVQINCNRLINKVMESRVINSKEEFHDNDCHATAGIDFTTKTLLYFPISTSGCTEPYHTLTVKIIENNIIYSVNIIHHGKKSDMDCDLLFSIYCSILVPKISKESKVDFQVIDSYAKDK
ncbi:MAG: hypothetical protein AABZ32_10810 [Bacteroidota bacterium]